MSFELPKGLPDDQWIVDGAEVRLSTSIGSFWLVTCSTETIARAIASIPDTVKEIERLRTLNAELIEALKECASDLEIRIEAEFNQIGRHKAMERDYQGYMSAVENARAILAKAETQVSEPAS
jgi:hypothetical protein